jgi:hypothetical protein
MEQCTSCGSYRAKNAEGMPYVDPEQQTVQQEGVRQDDTELPDPESDDGGSVWTGTNSSDNDSW